MEEMKVTAQDIFFFLKMSIFQFLLKSGFHFYNRDREVIFDLLTNDKKISIQNSITISLDNSLFLTAWVSIKKEFLDAQKLMVLANYLNEFSGVFSCYVQDTEEDFSLFYIKSQIHPEPGTCIDEDFWKTYLSIHINNFSTITDFIFFSFPKSKFYTNKEVDSAEFKIFFFNEIKSYVEALKLIQEETKKRNERFEGWTKEQLDAEIDKELENFSKGNNKEKVTMRLNLLVQALNKLEKS